MTFCLKVASVDYESILQVQSFSMGEYGPRPPYYPGEASLEREARGSGIASQYCAMLGSDLARLYVPVALYRQVQELYSVL